MKPSSKITTKQPYLLRTIISVAAVLLLLSSYSRAQSVELIIKKSTFTLDVIAGDSVMRSFRIALGKNAGDKQRRGDNRTPEGTFTIVQIQRSGSWIHDFRDGKGEIAGAYGPWFLRLGDGETHMKWRGIGIHGTHDPSSIGKLTTEGCIRLKNNDLEQLRALVKVGMRVTVIP